jgi:hypothetical protein
LLKGDATVPREADVSGEGDPRQAWWAAQQSPAAAAAPSGAAVEGARDASPEARPPVRRPGTLPPVAPRPHRPAPLGDQRGLTAAGAAILIVVLATIGLIVDAGRQSHLGIAFTLTLCVAGALAASTVHREDLLASVVMVPLIYLPLAIIGSSFDSTLDNSRMINVAETITEQAPTLIFAVLVTGIIAGLRAFFGRERGPRRIVTYR